VGDIVNLVIDRSRTRMESNVTITAADDAVIYLGKITVEILPAFPYKDAFEPFIRPRVLDADALAKEFASWDDNYTYKVAHNVWEATELIENGFEYVTERDGDKIYRKPK
ncbi:MAG: hypothetical protein JSV29_04325, partial [Candidatus Bathyarchaeota archaeon]